MADEDTSEISQPVAGQTTPSVPPEATTDQPQATIPVEAGVELNESKTQTAQIPVSEPLNMSQYKQAPAPGPSQAVNAPAPVHAARDLLVKARATIQDRKHKKLEKILEFLNTKGKITNDEVEKLLHVSDATATRYLSALEKEGKIKQVGKTGKAVEYVKI